MGEGKSRTPHLKFSYHFKIDFQIMTTAKEENLAEQIQKSNHSKG